MRRHAIPKSESLRRNTHESESEALKRRYESMNEIQLHQQVKGIFHFHPSNGQARDFENSRRGGYFVLTDKS